MKPFLHHGFVVVGLSASVLCACGSDDARQTDTSVMQLLSYPCREDGVRTSSAPDPDAAPGLKDAARSVGVAVNAAGLLDPAYARTVATEFNQLTPENEMKWEAIEPEPGVFDFTRADAIVSFASENGMQVRGHTLVWHSQLAPWVEALTGADAVREAMTRHIQTVVAHFRDTFPGTVVAWDVVNEAMNVMQGPMGGTAIYRDSVFYRELGEGFIAEAFQIARDTDPSVLLY
ncbi:MAG TPA: endo-1,4-beta-xylanase, partial [Polyangiaceae bacterium]|nr:endo-1,4-beta-xylanase [Polyangiaceae bacterium]